MCSSCHTNHFTVSPSAYDGIRIRDVTYTLIKNCFSFFLPFLLQDIKAHSLRWACLWVGEKMCFKAILEQEMSQSAWWQLIPQFEGSAWKSTVPSQLPLWNSSPPTKIDLSTWVTESGRMDGAGQTDISERLWRLIILKIDPKYKWQADDLMLKGVFRVQYLVISYILSNIIEYYIL